MQSNMSVLGLYNYDNTLFANMSYPTGFTSDDKTVLINNLLAELAELEVVYPRPDFMKSAIGFWSAKEITTWNRIYEAAKLEYNPIENYDRSEETTDTTEATRQHSGKDTNQMSGTDSSTTTIDGTVQNSGSDINASSGNDVTTNETAAFNSSTMVNHDKSTITHGLSSTLSHGLKTDTDETDTFSVTHGRKSELTHGEKIEDDTETTRESRIHGNIGVTTSQQMLEQELEVAPKLNIMNIIIESFKNRFCLLVY